MSLCQTVSRFGSIFGLILLISSTALAQMTMPSRAPTPSKTNKQKEKRDPTVSRSSPLARFDAETEAALIRANHPGVLLAKDPIEDHVYQIQILGTKKIEADAVLLQLKTRINEVLNTSYIQQDIKNIYAMGLFSNIVVEKEEGPLGSIKLVYNLEEKPTISTIKFEKNNALSEEDLVEVVDLKAFHVADLSRIKSNLEKIKKSYADKGYFLSDVHFRLEPVKKSKTEQDFIEVGKNKFSQKVSTSQISAPEFVDLVFEVDEGSKVRIQSISFIGNEKLSSDDIKAHMRSKENHPLGILTQWGTYNEDMFAIDLLLIEQFYQDKGFLNVQVQKPRIFLSEDKSKLFVKIPIVEGEQFKIGNIDISGDFIVENKEDMGDESIKKDEPSFVKADLKKKITLQNGEIFNRTQLMQEVLGIADLYRNEGYAYVNIVPETSIDDHDLKVDVKLQIESGQKVFYERIDIVGNTKTIDNVIRRELRIYEGDQASSAMMRLSEMRINQLGFFESVKINTKPGSSPDKMVVEIEVKEKRTGSFNAGFGYGTGGEGVLLQGQISQNNLFGRAQSLTGTIQWSGSRRVFDLRFVDPYLFYLGNAPITFAASVFNIQRMLGDYSRKSTGGEITFGYPIGIILKDTTRALLMQSNNGYEAYIPDFENLRLFLSYNLERVETNENFVGIDLFWLYSRQPRYTTGLRPVLQFDQRDNHYMPSAGYFLELRMEWASSYLGSGLLANWENDFTQGTSQKGIKTSLNYLKPLPEANNFLRYGANVRAYYNFDRWFFLKGWVLKLNVDLGVLNTFEKHLIAENYRLGGMGFGNSAGLRGYYFQSIGPVLNVSRNALNVPDYQFVAGGNKQFLMNLELEFPIVKALNISGVLFFDMGNVFNYGENFFYIGDKNKHHKNYNDPLHIFSSLGLYASTGFGFRWFSPFGPLRFEWGFPLVRRPMGTPGMARGDGIVQFEFNIGTSF